MAYEPAETTSSDPLDSDTAAVFAVLSECWRQPTTALVATVNEGALRGILPEGGDVHLDDLRREYTRLLLGPGPDQIPPYESVYRDRDAKEEELGSVRGASTEAVLKWYRSYGVTTAAEEPELPDHIAIELEFAAYLADDGDVEACEQFLDEHLRQWAGEFLSAIREQTRSPFYDSLAAATDTAIHMDLRES